MGGGDGEEGRRSQGWNRGRKRKTYPFVLLSQVCSVSCSVPGLAGRQTGRGPRESPLMTSVEFPAWVMRSGVGCDLRYRPVGATNQLWRSWKYLLYFSFVCWLFIWVLSFPPPLDIVGASGRHLGWQNPKSSRQPCPRRWSRTVSSWWWQPCSSLDTSEGWSRDPVWPVRCKGKPDCWGLWGKYSISDERHREEPPFPFLFFPALELC